MLETSVRARWIMGGLVLVAGCSSGAGEGTPSSGGGAATAGATASAGTTGNGGGVASSGGVGTAGSVPSGGTATAGAASGGGGASNGGASSGGSSTGGTASGGAAVGGASNGGTSNGGTSNGGTSNGGTSNGGTSNGGTSNGGTSNGGGGTSPEVAKFSFFVTSYPSMKKLSGKAEGFGGDLRFGKADGLSGADEICKQVAELGMPGAGKKQWRAFLSVTKGPNGTAVNARDRIGSGPWYDALGRLVANDLAGLFAGARPAGDAAVINDLPNEFGQPNHYTGPGGLQATAVDNHDTLTGSDTMGNLRANSSAETCEDWTSTAGSGRPYIGHSWPRSASNGTQWASDHQVPGCAAGIDKTLGGSGSGSCIGCSGGYGGFYCFALP
jgi:hypothetical protein